MDENGKKYPVFFLMFKGLYVIIFQSALIDNYKYLVGTKPGPINTAPISIFWVIILYIIILIGGPRKFHTKTRKILIYIDIGTIFLFFLVNIIVMFIVKYIPDNYVKSNVILTIIGCIGLCVSLWIVRENRTPFWHLILKFPG